MHEHCKRKSEKPRKMWIKFRWTEEIPENIELADQRQDWSDICGVIAPKTVLYKGFIRVTS